MDLFGYALAQVDVLDMCHFGTIIIGFQMTWHVRTPRPVASKLAIRQVTSCIIFRRVPLNESCHDRSKCNVFSILFCPQFLRCCRCWKLLFALAHILCLKYPLYWSPFVRFQVEAYFSTKEDEVVAGSSLEDMILKETNLY
ncbi:hypothetical protein C5167_018144 [Papaver somniferum]|uniref:Uncharacterized protein n=1 Tax=Papaver somniferum TaxID=3469 RepID=A0A4Y7ILF3_PAPSO|nr:hypothetical protein C5167_018144 [Papaver somniferum]